MVMHWSLKPASKDSSGFEFWGYRRDAAAKNVVIAYELDQETESRYQCLIEAIQCVGKAIASEFLYKFDPQWGMEAGMTHDMGKADGRRYSRQGDAAPSQ